MIRTTTHHFGKDLNEGKSLEVSTFVDAYAEAVGHCVSWLWGVVLIWGKENERLWNRGAGALDCPSMISTTDIGYEGHISGRALKCAATQACGIVRAVSEKKRRDVSKGKWYVSKGREVPKRLQERIDKEMTLPDVASGTVRCELNSICCDIVDDGRHFDKWVQLQSLWSSEEQEHERGFLIRVPVKMHRRALKWQREGLLKPSILLSKDHLCLRWESEEPAKLQEGGTLAIDQGLVDALTVSDGQKSVKSLHAHDLRSIVEKLARKRKGSKGFRRTQQHRENYVNWAVRQLNLTGVKELKLEDIEHITYGRRVSRRMGHWTNTLIRDALAKRCEEEGVLLTLVRCEYNSQRCSACGWVRKANRKGKVFRCDNPSCRECGKEVDADANAAQNILIRDTLFPLPRGLRSLRPNLKGFFWIPEGLFWASGQELTVPGTQS